MLIILVFATLCVWANLSFSKKKDVLPAQANINVGLDDWYRNAADSFLQQVLLLQQIHQRGGSFKQFKSQFIKTRHAFKKMEVLVSYFDAPTYLSLNSQLKPEVELEVSGFEFIQEPHGLQVLEALLERKKNFTAGASTITYEVNRIISTAGFLKTYHFQKPFTDTGFAKALQQEIVRITALGITGFDKPVLTDAIAETATALRGMDAALMAYASGSAFKDDIQNLQVKLEKCGQFITNTYRSFDQFDRLTFVRNYLQPVFAAASQMISKTDKNITDAPVSVFITSYIDELYHQPQKGTPELVKLGKALFETPLLSANTMISCSSCHKQDLAFADTLQRNTGFTFSDTLTRNTPTLLNVKYHIRFQRDGHLLSMKDQFKEVLNSHLEMGNISESSLLERVKMIGEFSEQIQRVFKVPEDGILYNMVLDALEAFMRSLISLNSDFDRYMTRTGDISPAVKNGFNLFMGKAKCGTCHFAPVFNGTIPPYCNKEDNEVIGITTSNNFKRPLPDKDSGLAQFTRLPMHNQSFKTPGVRNLLKTFPYMHNGSLQTLDDVLNFYNGGGARINIPHQTMDKTPLNLNKKELQDLKAFLTALN